MRRAEPAIEPISSDPRTMSSGNPVPTASRSAGSVTATADRPATSRVTRPEHVGDDRAGVLAQAVTDQHPQTGADEHCENVENGPETGKQRGHPATLRGWFNDHLSALPPGAPGV